MRAVTIASYGEASELTVSELDMPMPGPGQVRIETHAATVNPVDLGTRSGAAAAAIPDPKWPMVIGWDVAGIVDEVGEGVESFAKGDRVMAMSLWFLTRAGCYSEYVVLDELSCALSPAGIDDLSAATIPLNGLTAWSALAVAKAQPGDRVLVAGAAGAVGGYIVELAFRRGLTVTGFGRTDDLETIRSLGASEALDELGGHPPFDIAIDTTGNPDQVIDYMADGGKLLTLAGNVTREQRGVTVKAIGVRTNAEALAELSVMAGNRELTLRVAGTFPFDQAAQTHMLLGAGGVRGRLVLHP